MSKLLDYGREYFFVFPAELGGHDEPWISISEDCPPDIRERLERDWKIAKKKQKKDTAMVSGTVQKIISKFEALMNYNYCHILL